METPTLWVSADIARELGISGTDVPCRILELKELIYEILKEGGPRDTIVLPFFRSYAEIIKHIRGRGILGPIIIYSQGEAHFMNLADMASQGIIFMEAARFPRPVMIGFLTFLLKSQESIAVPPPEEKPKPRPIAHSTSDPAEIREFFQRLMRQRARILVTCQIREDLPTLSVTCEVIQMVGEVEPRLVLDKFNPPEFVGLYMQMSKGKPLIGFATMEEESLGFEFSVVHTVMGKVTAQLPVAVYQNQRKFFRVEPDAKEPVVCHILPDNGATMSFAVRDVSEGGIGMNVAFPGFALDASYPIGLALPGTKLILGSAHVMFKKALKADLYAYGMNFLLHESDRIKLRQYVYKRQAGIIAAIRKLNL